MIEEMIYNMMEIDSKLKFMKFSFRNNTTGHVHVERIINTTDNIDTYDGIIWNFTTCKSISLVSLYIPIETSIHINV